MRLTASLFISLTVIAIIIWFWRQRYTKNPELPRNSGVFLWFISLFSFTFLSKHLYTVEICSRCVAHCLNLVPWYAIFYGNRIVFQKKILPLHRNVRYTWILNKYEVTLNKKNRIYGITNKHWQTAEGEDWEWPLPCDDAHTSGFCWLATIDPFLR